ncbi:ribokinase [Ruegeria arenilitoris]|uniref:ribokinase n=1 Tax=Ruegeria arenilitoris TaxID=1173585 RepID=UPI00147E7DC8|nr:ribokinase [Ruegeria arenilitoris]
MAGKIAILGVFVADTAYRAERAPRMGETILGNKFALGPGGKGSNQAVAAARAGGEVHFISRLGQDDFADMALKTWAEAGVTAAVTQDPDSFTGAAYIFIEEASGDNAIIICPGAAGDISVTDVEARRDLIESAAVFVTQLEQPMAAAERGLSIARAAGAKTILNPAPAAEIPATMLALCDFVTPNESEAEGITGVAVHSISDAENAADVMLSKGVGAALVTLGEQGVLFKDRENCTHIPAMVTGPVLETTGAGDAFNGGFAAALAEGKDPVSAARFGCAVAGISVTRAGTAPSMPTRDEVDALLAANPII